MFLMLWSILRLNLLDWLDMTRLWRWRQISAVKPHVLKSPSGCRHQPKVNLLTKLSSVTPWSSQSSLQQGIPENLKQFCNNLLYSDTFLTPFQAISRFRLWCVHQNHCRQRSASKLWYPLAGNLTSWSLVIQNSSTYLKRKSVSADRNPTLRRSIEDK